MFKSRWIFTVLMVFGITYIIACLAAIGFSHWEKTRVEKQCAVSHGIVIRTHNLGWACEE